MSVDLLMLKYLYFTSSFIQSLSKATNQSETSFSPYILISSKFIKMRGPVESFAHFNHFSKGLSTTGISLESYTTEVLSKNTGA